MDQCEAKGTQSPRPGQHDTPHQPRPLQHSSNSVTLGHGYILPCQLLVFTLTGRFPTSRMASPRSVKHWSLTTLREKLIKIGAKVVRHFKYVTFQMAEVAVPRELFAAILDRIQRFGVPPPLVQRG